MIRPIKMSQPLAMRIGPPCPDQNGLHMRMVLQVLCEGGFHGERNALDVEVVAHGAGGDEGVYFGEGLWGGYEAGWDFACGGMCGGGGGAGV